MPEKHSRKAFVRPHKPTYWESGWNKLVGRDKKKDGDMKIAGPPPPPPPQDFAMQFNNQNDNVYAGPAGGASAHGSAGAGLGFAPPGAGATTPNMFAQGQDLAQNPRSQSQRWLQSQQQSQRSHQQQQQFQNQASMSTGSFPPPSHRNPAPGPSFAQTPLATTNFPRSSHRGLRSGELRAHEQVGGMTGMGERIRGVGGESAYIGSRIEGSAGQVGGGRGGGGGRSEHVWYPRASQFEAERTRVGRGGGYRRGFSLSIPKKIHRRHQTTFPPHDTNKMAKRKRSPSPAPAAAPIPARLKKLCTTLLTTAQKPLLTALRHGASLERQKHSRRKKTAVAKKDTKALARLDAEYTVLKGLDLVKLADQHLRRTVGKVKSLKEHEALREYVEGVEKGSQDPAVLNVLARLYKVKGVREPVDRVIVELKEVVGAGGSVAQSGEAKGGKPAKMPAKVEEEGGDVDMSGLSDEEGDAFAAFSARIAEPSSGEEDSDGSASDDERPPSIGDSNSEHDADADLDAASGSSEAAPLADLDSEDDDDDDEPAHINRLIAPPSDLSGSESDSDSESLKPPKTKSKPEPKFTSSAFLPGLSHAGYYSDSNSSASDLDTEAPRKNRRGQRARQKIAEAKFGAKAKHLEKVERNKGWDAKRGAVSDDRRGGRGDRGEAPRGRGPMQTGENALPLGKKKIERDDKGTLHPSWQAAKAAKEKKMIKIDLKGAPQGNKVVFD
ncbi:BUD22-domain-containing protein [Dothidotthia symphoricarpi CBS 119687]|uniref:BUD22-domain-containing protein n=1 Tax=Dothidotthia symphoricarpi CBS 119687 TaxID=1392245 RepID=A0A6A5ZZ62_9PLEO|nr:BUD22-domain-containing protein [Dothidotthia symphoricarpi CBS 119687]KAF2124047.1 BUD22-domain-containing protein [Dothidotthia symphoricarpi CBS 119687]